MSYRATVARQPKSLRDSFESARLELEGMDLSPLAHGLLAVTGIGASYAAAVVAAGEFRRRGRRAVAVRADDMVEGPELADAVMGLSHRGRSVETVAALKNSSSAGRLAITNDPDSPLAEAAGLHLRLNNGADATPSSTGYTATLLAAGMAFDRLTAADLSTWEALPDTAAFVLEQAGSRMARLGQLFADPRAIDCVGAGPALGTADGASLLLREAARIPASAYDTRHYLHGPMEAMDGRTAVVIFGSQREVELATTLEGIGCPVLLVTSSEEIDDGEHLTVLRVPAHENRIAQGIVDILAAQLLAATLSDAAGLTDVKFRYRQSDTKIAEQTPA